MSEAFVEFVNELINNPLAMAFAIQWGLGWFLKHKTNLNNNVIPFILVATGCGLGVLLLNFGTTNNIFVGFMITLFQIGAFEGFKSGTKLMKE